MSSQDNNRRLPKNTPNSSDSLIPDNGRSGNKTLDLEEAKANYLELLLWLDWDLGPEYKPEISYVRSHLEKADDPEQLRKAVRLLRKKLNTFVRLMMAEREESSQFIIETARRLGEVETHLKASALGAAAIYKESEGFTTTMIGDVREIHTGAKNSTNLGEVMELVLAGLDKFKTVLENHRDQQRRHIKTVSIELDQMWNRFNQVQDQLSRMEQENQSLSSRLREDPLTGARNRLALEERVHQELGLMDRGKQVFSLLMIDLDHFKRINDTYGHAIGDNCLIEVVAKLERGLRVSDMLARYGGDEFVAVLPASGLEGARNAAEKLRRLVAGTDFTVKGRRVPVTVSIGVTEGQPTDKSPQDTFARADQALYEAKKSGRNQVRDK